MSKPRLCDVLGVAVNEKFYTPDYNFIYYVNEEGYLEYIDNEGVSWTAAPYDLADLINNPEKIMRWTKKDIDDIKAIKQLWPKAIQLSRYEDACNGELGLYISFKYNNNQDFDVVLTSNAIVPSLKSGKTIIIDDFLKVIHQNLIQ